jgi:hypothetical protein
MPLGNGKVAVQARQVPLGRLLEEVAALLPLDITMTDPALAQHAVNVTLDEVPLNQVVARILLQAELSFAVGGLKGGPLRVVIGGADLGVIAAQGQQVGYGSASEDAQALNAQEALPSEPSEPPQPGQAGGGRPVRPVAVSVADETPFRAPEPGQAGSGTPARPAPAQPAPAVADVAPVALPAPGQAGSGQALQPSDTQVPDLAEVSEAPSSQTVSEVPEVVYVPPTSESPGFSMIGESVTYDDPAFVPYKNTAAAKHARQSVDVSTIP